MTLRRLAANLPRAAGGILLLSGVFAAGAWLASLRKGDYVHRVAIVDHFGNPGWDWHIDFLSGQFRIVVKESDLAIVYLPLPGWLPALVFMISGIWLLRRASRWQRAPRGFEITLSNPPEE